MTRAFDKAVAPLELMVGLRNKFINPMGMFSIQQRIISESAPALIAVGTAAIISDRWWVENQTNQSIYAFPKVDTDGTVFLRINAVSTAPTTGFVYVYQKIEHVKTLAQKRVVFSYSYRHANALAIIPYVQQNFGSGGSSQVIVNLTPKDNPVPASASQFTRTWAWGDVPSISGKTLGGAHNLTPALPIPLRGTGPIDLKEFQIEEVAPNTNEPWPFEERHEASELILCKRYYKQFNSYGSAATQAGLYMDANNIGFLFPLGIESLGMRVTGALSFRGAQGSDYYISTAGGVAQTGFVFALSGIALQATKASHGLTAGQVSFTLGASGSSAAIFSAEI